MRPYRLPLKFIGLWAANLIVLLILGIGLGLNEKLAALVNIRNNQNLVYLYLFVGGILALLEQELWDKLRGE